MCLRNVMAVDLQSRPHLLWILRIAGIVFFILGVILLISLGIENVTPHTEISDWEEATCTVQNFTKVKKNYGDLNLWIKPWYVTCTCISDDRYDDDICLTPCFTVRVKYQDIHGNWQEQARLYKDIVSLLSQPYPDRCSYVLCEDDNFKHTKKLEDAFIETYANIGTSYACLYNPHNLDRVLLEWSSSADAANSIFWPLVLTLIGLALILWTSLKNMIAWVKMSPLKKLQKQSVENSSNVAIQENFTQVASEPV